MMGLETREEGRSMMWEVWWVGSPLEVTTNCGSDLLEERTEDGE